MYKKLTTILATLVFGLFVTAVSAHAAVSVRLEQPKSPNNNDTFNITFVALDTDGNPLTVKCFKGTSPIGTQFGGDIALSGGGNTENCQVNSSVIPADGTYDFYVTATNGSETATSNPVSVEIKRNGPGTPGNYSKNKITSCEYKIHFRTADDGGKTVKVEVYRSENKTFNADSGSRVGTVSIGSNTDYDFIQSVPDCGKTYYYAVRAFDNAGNGSGVVGDSETVTTTNTINPTTTSQQGAIPVSGSNQGGSVLGSEATVSPTGEEKANKDTKGSDEESSDSDKGVKAASASSWFTPGKIIGIIVIVIAIVLAYWYFRNRAKK